MNFALGCCCVDGPAELVVQEPEEPCLSSRALGCAPPGQTQSHSPCRGREQTYDTAVIRVDALPGAKVLGSQLDRAALAQIGQLLVRHGDAVIEQVPHLILFLGAIKSTQQ